MSEGAVMEMLEVHCTVFSGPAVMESSQEEKRHRCMSSADNFTCQAVL